MSIMQVSEDQLPYKFATTLIFTNGLCPFCKEQVYELNGDKMSMKADIEKGKEHYKRHKKEYKRNVVILGSLGLGL